MVSHPVHIDRPERIAVDAAGDTAAFVIGPGPTGPGEATGLWHGRLSGEPAKLDGTVPDTNLAFAPEGTRLALAVQEQAGSTVIVADPAEPPASWLRYPLPAFAEQVAWTEAGLIVLAADPGADAASLTSGKPLPAAEQDPVVLPRAGGAGFRRLWRVDPGTGDAAPVSPADLAIWEFAPVPGGGAIVVASDDPAEAGWYHSRWSSWTRRGPGSGCCWIRPGSCPARRSARTAGWWPASRAGPATGACWPARSGCCGWTSPAPPRRPPHCRPTWT